MNNFTDFDKKCMQKALELAQIAAVNNEVPVGAVLVHNNIIIGEGYNQPITTKDPTAHAEIIALREGAKYLNNYRLIDTTLYVTLEPCAMCAGAMLHARIKRVVFATNDPRTGVLGGAINLFQIARWNHQIDFMQGLLQEPCAHILKDFFQKRR